MRTRFGIFVVLGSVTTVAAVPIAASESSSARMEVEEIVVTAERRESSLQKTPVAISAFSEEFLNEGNINTIQDLAPYAPGLNYTQVSNFVQLNMRGIGLEQINLGGEPGVAFHQDGVYVARPFVNNALFDDLARVEVLRGPQGTLYGRNATGGSINLIPNRPTDTFEGQVSLGLGNYDRRRASAMLSGPLTSDGGVRGRISVVSDQRDGYLDNRSNGEDLEDFGAQSARGEIDFDLSESLTLAVAADYLREDDTGPVFRPGSIPGTAAALGGTLSNDPWKIYVDGRNDQNVHAWGGSARLTWETDAFSVMSLTAYRNNSFQLRSDLDGTDFFLVNEDLSEDAQQFSQEVQLASLDDGPWQWLVGAYYFHEDGDLDYIFPIPVLATTIRFDAEQETTAYALFGQVTYAFTEKLSATVGLRYSDERKEGMTEQTFFVVNNVKVDDGWAAFTPRFVLDYQISDAAFAYLSVAKGFKTGGINTGSLQSKLYDPEYIWNYEIGIKTRGWEGRIQANIAAFYYEYDDLQVTQFAVGQTFIENAASAEGRGVELEIAALISERFSLNLTLAYLDTEFTDYQSLDSFRPTLGVLKLDGNELPRAPDFSASVVARYEIPLPRAASLTLQGEFQHQDEQYFTPFNTSYAQGGEFDLWNARVAYASADDRWSVALFGRNLGDEEYEQATTVSGINAGTLVLFGPPRTYGLEGSFRF